MDPLTDTHVPPVPAGSPASQVTALYQRYATGLVRLAMLMLADQQAAEDVVQEAFLGLYRRWGSLADPGKALTYVRSSVLNGCRTVLRKRSRRLASYPEPDAESAEAVALPGQEHREVLLAWTGAGGTAIGVIEAMAKGQMTIDYTVGLLTPGKFTPLPIRVPAAQGFSAAGLAF
jgi:Sigma-70 region 2